MPAMTRVANAPVNFGIYRATSAPIGPRELLTELAEAGYDGVDSGPIGYLGADDLPTSRHGRGNAIGGSAPAGAHRHRRLPGHRPPVARRGRPRGRAAGLVGPDPADPCQGR